jgi:uncharacterized membrane protein (UPF0127 family)
LIPILVLLGLCTGILSLSRENIWSSIKGASSETSGEFVQASIPSLNGNIKQLNLELAATRREQAQGLMYKRELKANNGMLFVFDESDHRTFWMKNTYISLDIAFLDQDRKILNICHNTKPMDTDKVYKSNGKAMYVIETNANWFEENDIQVGETFNFSL